MSPKAMLDNELVHVTFINITFSSDCYDIAIWLIVFHLSHENDLKFIKFTKKPFCGIWIIIKMNFLIFNKLLHIQVSLLVHGLDG